MNLQAIRQQIQREVQASPAKAIALVLLALVGVWFWIPIAWGWVAKKSNAKTAPVAATPVTTSGMNLSLQIPTDTGQTAAPSADAWRQRAAEWEQDPRRRPSEAPELSRDPFARPQSPQDAAEEAEAIRETRIKARAVDPADLGWKLDGTIVSPEARSAMINGITFRQGEEIHATEEVSFVLSHVEARRVVLSRQGKDFELTIAQRPLPNGMQWHGGDN